MIYPTAVELQKSGNLGLTPAERLLSRRRVESNGCWRWTGSLTSGGYGHLSIRSIYYQAHLLMHILLVGPIPIGLEPDHLCRNRWCVNPSHLEFVTHAVNVRRGIRVRLTAEQVASIRQAHSEGTGVRVLARRYGVNHGHVSRIVNDLIWREAAA